jgi:hypothetical protein
MRIKRIVQIKRQNYKEYSNAEMVSVEKESSSGRELMSKEIERPRRVGSMCRGDFQ